MDLWKNPLDLGPMTNKNSVEKERGKSVNVDPVVHGNLRIHLAKKRSSESITQFVNRAIKNEIKRDNDPK